MSRENIINKTAKLIKDKIEGGTLYGQEIDSENINHMIVAAYFIGKNAIMNDRRGLDKCSTDMI